MLKNKMYVVEYGKDEGEAKNPRTTTYNVGGEVSDEEQKIRAVDKARELKGKGFMIFGMHSIETIKYQQSLPLDLLL